MSKGGATGPGTGKLVFPWGPLARFLRHQRHGQWRAGPTAGYPRRNGAFKEQQPGLVQRCYLVIKALHNIMELSFAVQSFLHV